MSKVMMKVEMTYSRGSEVNISVRRGLLRWMSKQWSGVEEPQSRGGPSPAPGPGPGGGPSEERGPSGPRPGGGVGDWMLQSRIALSRGMAHQAQTPPPQPKELQVLTSEGKLVGTRYFFHRNDGKAILSHSAWNNLLYDAVADRVYYYEAPEFQTQAQHMQPSIYVAQDFHTYPASHLNPFLLLLLHPDVVDCVQSYVSTSTESYWPKILQRYSDLTEEGRIYSLALLGSYVCLPATMGDEGGESFMEKYLWLTGDAPWQNRFLGFMKLFFPLVCEFARPGNCYQSDQQLTLCDTQSLYDSPRLLEGILCGNPLSPFMNPWAIIPRSHLIIPKGIHVFANLEGFGDPGRLDEADWRAAITRRLKVIAFHKPAADSVVASLNPRQQAPNRKRKRDAMDLSTSSSSPSQKDIVPPSSAVTYEQDLEMLDTELETSFSHFYKLCTTMFRLHCNRHFHRTTLY